MRKMTRNEIGMIIIIIMLAAGIASRWSYIKKEAGEAIEHRLNRAKPTR